MGRDCLDYDSSRASRWDSEDELLSEDDGSLVDSEEDAGVLDFTSHTT